ncbi:MAG: MFS transporter [Bifidobacteriaceae bacterium]|jgi:MFS family permease|nr:MFS transporter [Bifidobacteriaceae bacterium]
MSTKIIAEKSQPKLISIVGTLIFVELVSGILQGYYVPVYKEISVFLHISDATINILPAGLMLIGATFVPLIAKLGDIFGFKQILAATSAITVITSWGLVISPNFIVFLIFWMIQGVYMSWLPLVVALINGRLRGVAQASNLTRKSSGVVVASLQGGAILGAAMSGQVGSAMADKIYIILMVPAIFCTVNLLVILFGVKKVEIINTSKIDIIGAVWLSISLALICFGFAAMNLQILPISVLIIMIIIGVVILVPFALFEKTQNQPLININVLADKTVWPIIVAACLTGTAILGAQAPLSTFARTNPSQTGYGLGLSASQISYVILAFVLSMLIGALLLSTISKIVGPRIALILPCILITLGYGIMIFMHTLLIEVLINIIVAGLGAGMLIAGIPAFAANAAPAGQAGIITGLTNTSRSIGGSIASATFALALAQGTAAVSASQISSQSSSGSLEGYIFVWTACAITAVLAGIAFWFLPKHSNT